jgi:hypothetical protein
MSGTGETTQCREATRGLTAHPAQSEHPGTEINYFQKQPENTTLLKKEKYYSLLNLL